MTGAAPAASAGGFDHVDVPSRGDAPRQRLTRRDFEALPLKEMRMMAERGAHIEALSEAEWRRSSVLERVEKVSA